MSSRISKTIGSLPLIGLAFVSFLTIIPFQQAHAYTPNTFFGGKIDKVTYCPCAYDPAVILSIKDETTHQTVNVKYSLWFSKLYANYNIWNSGPETLGGFTRGSYVCLQQSGYYCKTNNDAPKPIDGMIDWIRGIGSSGFGGSFMPSLSSFGI